MISDKWFICKVVGKLGVVTLDQHIGVRIPGGNQLERTTFPVSTSNPIPSGRFAEVAFCCDVASNLSYGLLTPLLPLVT